MIKKILMFIFVFVFLFTQNSEANLSVELRNKFEVSNDITKTVIRQFDLKIHSSLSFVRSVTPLAVLQIMEWYMKEYDSYLRHKLQKQLEIKAINDALYQMIIHNKVEKQFNKYTEIINDELQKLLTDLKVILYPWVEFFIKDEISHINGCDVFLVIDVVTNNIVIFLVGGALAVARQQILDTQEVLNPNRLPVLQVLIMKELNKWSVL